MVNLGYNEKAEIVFKFLLTPIRSGEYIKWHTEKIISSQRYQSGFDPDMSDISVEFYKIIYGLDIVNNKGKLNEKEFAGDTMCSFNTIANCVEGAGKTVNQRTPYEQWPRFLQDYFDIYHCLANFWVLPMWVGRSYPKMPEEHKWASKTGNGDGIKRQDYMDRFLSFIKNHYIEFIEQYGMYGYEFPSFYDFVEKHYLQGEKNYISEKGYINSFSQQNPEAVVYSMKEKIEGRARSISKSCKCNDLYNWIIGLESSDGI